MIEVRAQTNKHFVLFPRQNLAIFMGEFVFAVRLRQIKSHQRFTRTQVQIERRNIPCCIASEYENCVKHTFQWH